MHKIIVVGGGAAGMFAAYFSAKLGKEVVLLEKNEKLGKKIYITGKGRCNLTNDVEPSDFFNNVVNNPKFLYGSIYSLSPESTQKFFEDMGLSLKVERGNRVFPLSDKASDVTKTLEKALKEVGVEIKLNNEVVDIQSCNGAITSVVTKKEILKCDSVIIATGGISYPSTGSTGDGYRFAESFGHNIIQPKSALCGIELKGSDFIDLQGLSLKNIAITISSSGKKVYGDFGEMLFTHFGVSGPVILSASSVINRLDFNKLRLIIDLKPALDESTLDARLVREFSENKTKNLFSVMRALIPQTLIDTVLNKSSLNGTKKCGEITREERKKILYILKNLTFELKKLRPIDEAIVTSGGVSVEAINPKTMESKIVKGLFFAGEVLDVDCFTGGFNLQTAFSTGYTAGINA